MREVLIVNTSGLGVGGMTTHMLNYIEKIIKKNYIVKFTIVVTGVRDNEIIAKFINAGCSIVFLPDRKKELIKYIKELFVLAKQHKFDAIHVHGNSSTMMIELKIAKICGIPTRIAHCHNSRCEHQLIHNVFKYSFMKSYTHAVACSELAGDWIFGKNNYTIVPNAIDINKFKYNEKNRNIYRNKLQIDDDAIVLGHVGNFNEQKNHEFLIDVFRSFHKTRHSKLILIGTGPLISKVKEKVDDFGLQNDVVFLGLKDDVNDWMQAMDVFVFPSRWEGFGMVVVEAQAANLPVVASTEVPTVTRVSNSIKYLSLDSGIRQWEKSVFELFEITNRNAQVDNRVKVYDIDANLQNVVDLYGLE